MVNATRQVARDQRDSSAVTESEQDAIRSLGSLEHLFWLLDQHHFVHFAVTALISGETSPLDWRRALDRLQKRHPILSVCIDGAPNSVPLFRQADVTPIPLRIVEDEPELRWEVEVGKELATRFNPSRAPLIRAEGPVRFHNWIDYSGLTSDQWQRVTQHVIRRPQAARAQTFYDLGGAGMRTLQAAAGGGAAIIRALAKTVVAAAGKWWRAHTIRRARIAAIRELHALDDRTLRDIGVSRSEIEWLVVHGIPNRS